MIKKLNEWFLGPAYDFDDLVVFWGSIGIMLLFGLNLLVMKAVM